MFTGQQIVGMILFFSVISWLASMLVTYKMLVKKCEHDYEKISQSSYMIVYRCKKCGEVQKILIV